MNTDNTLAATLHADGPHPAAADRLAMFGQFIGAWHIDNRIRERDGSWSMHHGRWDFGWILGGLAVQDVLDCPTASNRYPGTTIRCYHPPTDRWHAVWLDPHSGMYVTLRAHSNDHAIILDGTTQHGTTVHWKFFDITDTSFQWHGSLTADGESFELVQEMTAHRM
ncbi:hypothetical protein ACFXHA_40970 [Nocardia sp. NPDC059240]|uniref:hypothetical protein n=1 Tax=Nocardia sp. NPDC059240 TaxID=3346786 RepID=UPI0036C23939